MRAYLEVDETERLEKAATYLRDRLLIRLLVRLGCRISEALARATAREHAEKIISRMVVSGADVTEEQAERIYQRELRKISRKFTHMRYHSFLVYFGVLKRLGWVEATNSPLLNHRNSGLPSSPLERRSVFLGVA